MLLELMVQDGAGWELCEGGAVLRQRRLDRQDGEKPGVRGHIIN